MQKTTLEPSDSARFILRRIFLLYIGLAFTSLTFAYLGGVTRVSRMFPVWHALSWSYATAFACVIDYGIKMNVARRSSRAYKYLFLAPALTQLAQDFSRFIFYRDIGDQGLNEELGAFLGIIDITVAFIGVNLLRSAYIAHKNRLGTSDVKSETPVPPDDDSSPVESSPSTLLGRGDGYIDRVIHSVMERSVKSEHVANFSMYIMLALVMIGGMASFGLWIFTHADRISTLEAQRKKLITLQEGFKDAQVKLGSNNEELKVQLDRLIKFIDHDYSDSEPYKEAFNRLSLQSQTNYADIAIRVTIAVLTIFLVQVFFAVYKYNRHLAIMLGAKAEALELAGNDADARKELSREAVSIVKESVPGFGARPRTPLEEVVQMAEKLRKRE